MKAKLALASGAAITLVMLIGSLGGVFTIETLNTVIVFAFMVLLLAGAITTVARGIAYLREHEPMPRLLIRDIISRTSLAIPLTLIFGVRALRPFVAIPENLGESPIWILVTGVPAVFGVAVYAYFEIFILGGPDRDLANRRNLLSVIVEKIDDNTEISQNAFHEANTVNQKIAELKQQFDDLIKETLIANKQRDTVTDARNAALDAREAVRDSADRRRDGQLQQGSETLDDTHERVVDIHSSINNGGRVSAGSGSEESSPPGSSEPSDDPPLTGAPPLPDATR